MRNKSKSEYWNKRIGEYQRSMLSMVKWCMVNRESVHKLRYWIDKFNKAGVTIDNTDKCETGVQWLSVVPQACEDETISQADSGAIHIWVKSFKVSVCSGFDKLTLADVVEVLKQC